MGTPPLTIAIMADKKQGVDYAERRGAAFFADPGNDRTGNYEIMANCDEYYWPNISTEFGIPFDTLPFMYDEWPKEQAKCPLWLATVDPIDPKYQQGHLFARKIMKNTDLRLHWMGENNGKETDCQDTDSCV